MKLPRLPLLGWAAIIVPAGFAGGFYYKQLLHEADERKRKFELDVLQRVHGYDKGIVSVLSDQRRFELLKEKEALQRDITALRSELQAHQ